MLIQQLFLAGIGCKEAIKGIFCPFGNNICILSDLIRVIFLKYD